MNTRRLVACLAMSLTLVACGLGTVELPAPSESAPASLSSSPSPTALPTPSPTALPTASRTPFPWAYRDLSKIVLDEGDLEPGETIDSLDVGLDALLQPVALLENSTFGDQPGFVDARMTRIGIEGQDSYWEVGGYVSWAAVYANSSDGDLAFHVLVSEHESEVGWGMEQVGRDAYGFEGVSLDGAAYGWDTNRLYIWREGNLILAAGALGSTTTSDDALERLEEIARIMDARAADWNWVDPSAASPSPSSSPSPRAGICAQPDRVEIDVPPVVRQYLAAWNERDTEARLRVLDEIWAEDATYIGSPGMADAPVVGRAAMSELIARNQGAPGEWIEPRAWFEGYDLHDVLVMPWRHCTPDGPSGTIGTDYAELDPSGRITLAVGFSPLTPDDSGMGDQPPRVCAGFETLDLSAVPRIIERYTAAWNVPTSAEREAILRAISDDETQYAASWDPSTPTGPAEITAFIDQWRGPGNYIEFSAWGDADYHDGWFHVRWRDCAPGGDFMAGIEILHAGSDGKLERVASFGAS